MEEDGADERDDDGRKVIAQCGDGNARIAVGLEEQDPVHTHCRAGEKQQRHLFFDAREGDPLPADK